MLSLCYNDVNCNLQQGQCKFDHKSVGATAAGIVQIPSGSEEDLESAVATAGPIAVAIDASSNAFRVSSICSWSVLEIGEDWLFHI